MNEKTKAENIKLFEEARTLREKVRASLHEQAANRYTSEKVCLPAQRSAQAS